MRTRSTSFACFILAKIASLQIAGISQAADLPAEIELTAGARWKTRISRRRLPPRYDSLACKKLDGLYEKNRPIFVHRLDIQR